MDTENTEISTDWMDDLDDSVFDDSTDAYTDSEGNAITADEFYEQGGTQLAELEDGFGEPVEDNTVDSNSKADTDDGTDNKVSDNLNTDYFGAQINNEIKLNQMNEEQMQKIQEEAQKQTDEVGKLAAANAASGNQLAYGKQDLANSSNSIGDISYRTSLLGSIIGDLLPGGNDLFNTRDSVQNEVRGAYADLSNTGTISDSRLSELNNALETINGVLSRGENRSSSNENYYGAYEQLKNEVQSAIDKINDIKSNGETSIPGISSATEQEVINRAEEDGISLAEAYEAVTGRSSSSVSEGLNNLQSRIDSEAAAADESREEIVSAATEDSPTTETPATETPATETPASSTPSTTTPSTETPATSTEEAEAEIATAAASTPTTTPTEELDESEYIPEVPVDETTTTTPVEEPIEEEVVEAGETTTPAEETTSTTPTDETIEEESSEGSDSEETEETKNKNTKGSVIWVPKDTPETIQWEEDGSCSIVNESVNGDKYKIDLPAEAGEAYDNYKAALNSGDEKAAKAAAEQLAAIVQGANRSDNNPVGWARNTGAKWESKSIVGKVGMVAGFLLKAGLTAVAPGAVAKTAITKAVKNIIDDAKDTQNILLVMGVDPKDIPGKITTQIAYLQKNMNNREFLKAVENDMDDTGTEELSTEEAQSLATKMTKNGYDSRNTSATDVGDYNQGMTEEENKVVSDSSKKIIKYAPYVRIAVKKW